MKHEIRLSGAGGQGLVLAGIVLGEAAAIYDNLYALQKQSYGPEARGGASRSDVIISDQEIEYPVVDEPDILLSMSQDAYNKYARTLKKDGILLIDKSLVSMSSTDIDARVYSIDFTKSARSLFGMEIVANVIALGAVINVLEVVSRDSVMRVLEKRIPPKFHAVNQKAFELGMKLSKEV